MLSSLIVTGTYWEVWAKLLDDKDTNVFILYICSVTYFLAFIFSIVLVGFTTFHIRLTMTNYTTLEYCEKKKVQVSYFSTNDTLEINLAKVSLLFSKMGLQHELKTWFRLFLTLVYTNCSF